MPRRVYMPDEFRLGGGSVFHVTWENLESYLRGDDPRGGTPALKPDESCEFVVTATGVNVYVMKRGE